MESQKQMFFENDVFGNNFLLSCRLCREVVSLEVANYKGFKAVICELRS